MIPIEQLIGQQTYRYLRNNSSWRQVGKKRHLFKLPQHLILISFYMALLWCLNFDYLINSSVQIQSSLMQGCKHIRIKYNRLYIYRQVIRSLIFLYLTFLYWSISFILTYFFYIDLILYFLFSIFFTFFSFLHILYFLFFSPYS